MTITELLRDIRNGLVDGSCWIYDHALGILLALMLMLLSISFFASTMAAIASLR